MHRISLRSPDLNDSERNTEQEADADDRLPRRGGVAHPQEWFERDWPSRIRRRTDRRSDGLGETGVQAIRLTHLPRVRALSAASGQAKRRTRRTQVRRVCGGMTPVIRTRRRRTDRRLCRSGLRAVGPFHPDRQMLLLRLDRARVSADPGGDRAAPRTRASCSVQWLDPSESDSADTTRDSSPVDLMNLSKEAWSIFISSSVLGLRRDRPRSHRPMVDRLMIPSAPPSAGSRKPRSRKWVINALPCDWPRCPPPEESGSAWQPSSGSAQTTLR
jgi:hypothetical protein